MEQNSDTSRVKTVLGIVFAAGLMLLGGYQFVRFKATRSPAWATTMAIEELKAGVVHMEKGEYPKAIKDLNAAIKIDPKLFAAYNNRALCWLASQDLDRAQADLDKVVELDPNNVRAYVNRGATFAKKKEWDNAISDFTRAIELDPGQPDAYGYRGDAYFQKGNSELLAFSDYRRAIEIDPRSAAIYYYKRGVVYGQMGETRKAIEDFTRAIKRAPEFGPAYQGRAIAYFDTKDYESSWKDVANLKSLKFEVNAVFLDALKKASDREEK